MQTQPKIVDRPAQPYVAAAREVRMPFGPMIDEAMGTAAGWLEGHGVSGFGPAIFKYNVIDMPRLEIEFGFLTPTALTGDANVVAGTLPAGRYATLTYTGHYDNVQSATGSLIDWAKAQGIAWDSEAGPDGERFVARFEIYPNGPMDEPDPNKWITEIWIKVRG